MNNCSLSEEFFCSRAAFYLFFIFFILPKMFLYAMTLIFTFVKRMIEF